MLWLEQLDDKNQKQLKLQGQKDRKKTARSEVIVRKIQTGNKV